MPKPDLMGMHLQDRLQALLLHVDLDWLLRAIAVVGLVVLAITLERVIYFWWCGTNAESLRKTLNDMLKRHQLSRAEELLKKRRSHAARIAAQALGRLEHGPAAIEEVVAGARLVERLKLERGLATLSTLGYVVLGLGLFGTLLGLLHAFAAPPAQVLPGTAEALTVGAAALGVALPDLIICRWLQHIIRKRLLRADTVIRVILAYAKSKR